MLHGDWRAVSEALAQSWLCPSDVLSSMLRSDPGPCTHQEALSPELCPRLNLFLMFFVCLFVSGPASQNSEICLR